jgi:hypothetical protein
MLANSQIGVRLRSAVQLSSTAKASNAANNHRHATGRRKTGGTLGWGVSGIRLILAVVTKENIAVAGADPASVTWEGETVQVKQLVVKFTVPVNPATGVIVMVVVAVWPAEIVIVDGFADRLKSVTVTLDASEVDGP